jgi:hypothetical protein
MRRGNGATFVSLSFDMRTDWKYTVKRRSNKAKDALVKEAANVSLRPHSVNKQ